MKRWLLLGVFLIIILGCNLPGSSELQGGEEAGSDERTPTPDEPEGVATPTPALTTITVYFTNQDRYSIGTLPYEDAVTRIIPVPESLPEAVIKQLFIGPTADEQALGLVVVLSGTTGFSKFVVNNGVAHIYLTGTCHSNGATYTIASLISKNLEQFAQIQWIKIYDENGETETPEGQSSSIPFCLEP